MECSHDYENPIQGFFNLSVYGHPFADPISVLDRDFSVPYHNLDGLAQRPVLAGADCINYRALVGPYCQRNPYGLFSDQ